MFKKALLGLLVGVVTLSALAVLPVLGDQISREGTSGFRALNGSAASDFVVPDDME